MVIHVRNYCEKNYNDLIIALLLQCHQCSFEVKCVITAPFNNMRTLTLKAQPTNAFFATVNQMFAGSSQLPQIVDYSSDNIVGRWEKPSSI